MGSRARGGDGGGLLANSFFSNGCEREGDVQEGEREVADGGEDGGGGGEEEGGRQLGPRAGDAQKVKTPLKLSG